MALYRKDFETIARAINDARIAVPLAEMRASRNTADVAAHKLADYLATTNKAFDRARFLAAAGVKN